MKKSIILKSFLVVLVAMMLTFVTSSVYAATDSDFDELLDSSGDNNTPASNKNNTPSNKNNTPANTNNTPNTNGLKNNTNNTNNGANNTSLPKTGAGDSLPTALLIAVFGISAVYAYKKVSDYRNID